MLICYGNYYVEKGPVYGPTLPLEAENPNVVMGGIYPNPRIYVFATSQTFLHLYP